MAWVGTGQVGGMGVNYLPRSMVAISLQGAYYPPAAVIPHQPDRSMVAISLQGAYYRY